MMDTQSPPTPPRSRPALRVVVPLGKQISTAKRPDVDWERVEFQYRAGILTLREIGAEHGMSHNSVDKRAKTRGWVRDLKAKIVAKAQELVDRAQVTPKVTSKSRQPRGKSSR